MIQVPNTLCGVGHGNITAHEAIPRPTRGEVALGDLHLKRMVSRPGCPRIPEVGETHVYLYLKACDVFLGSLENTCRLDEARSHAIEGEPNPLYFLAFCWVRYILWNNVTGKAKTYNSLPFCKMALLSLACISNDLSN